MKSLYPAGELATISAFYVGLEELEHVVRQRVHALRLPNCHNGIYGALNAATHQEATTNSPLIKHLQPAS